MAIDNNSNSSSVMNNDNNNGVNRSFVSGTFFFSVSFTRQNTAAAVRELFIHHSEIINAYRIYYNTRVCDRSGR